MKFFIFFALLAAVYLPLVENRCRTTGSSFGPSSNRAFATQLLTEVCGEFQGTYGPGQHKAICRNGRDGGPSFVYYIKHVSGGYRPIGHTECTDGLNKEIVNCDRGGRTAYKNWEYSVDPNKKPCH
ncbi:hypothetical protein BY996DRAFT_6957024 [Phakopsora pachyrhizi]|uniref:Secreted protein n=1 Tax=Phakopsora pachyrhizi TaxID=170000 RepID=A0AAV0ARH5_PHAPC|nr:hypothetical protein BY996DRAFT_6957024 [Phakopsora pachyrhizi]CAH7671885.1 hypothetical protein PPACK8108_LOCUS6723 [Phakopsora pachyrhizi]